MPIDQYEEDAGDAKEMAQQSNKRKFDEFDCPGCDANNPCDPAFGDAEEVLCNFCGTYFLASVNEDGRLKLKEV
jgi:ribosomal protein S27E